MRPTIQNKILNRETAAAPVSNAINRNGAAGNKWRKKMVKKNTFPGGGRGQGARGKGAGSGMGSGSGGRGRKGGNQPGAGPGGNCLCPNCGAKIPHKQGQPCFNVICPQCGSQMLRE